MINSINTMDVIKPKLLNMDKFANVTSSAATTAAAAAARLHHHNASQLQNNITPARDYITFIRKSFPVANSDLAASSTLERQERVKVQHLENHTKLQNNNCWNNFRTLYNLSASSAPISKGGSYRKEENTADLKVDDPNQKQQQQQQSNMDIKNKSAFNIELNKHRYIYSNNNSNLIINTNNNNNNNNSLTAAASDTNKKSNCNNNNNNNHLNAKQQQQGNKILINREQQSGVMIVGPPHRRTEDQEHAYRRIESVHNYAKLKTYDDDENNEDITPNGSRHSSNLEDDDEEEDDDDDDDVDYEEDNKRNGIFEEDDDLDAEYEDILNRRRFAKINKTISTKPLMDKYHHRTQSIQPHEDEIDVETVEQPNGTILDNNDINNINNGPSNESSIAKPEHHARRPMNAFLIFCKRHRAIVKERYKTLENRAITKILGDWWASLEANDKECFTNLAQQNKDAFFSANPNFKWYKLPAPPLRTLSTRPTNGLSEYENYTGPESICQNTRSNCNIFKLADEAQMGDLSHLMQDKSRHKQCAALQQALGETSHFMSTHLMGGDTEPRPYNENSNLSSSNSSEDDGLVPKIKSSRSCKGKRYQELINSGQITAPAVKKSKTTSQQRLAGDVMNLSTFLQANMGQNDVISAMTGKNRNEMQRLQDPDNGYAAYDTYAPFDLEEKIKELPALCLDDYLQRKRNTKKKKKLSSNGKRKGGAGGHISNRNHQIKNTNVVTTKKSPINNFVNNIPPGDMMVRLQQRKQHQQQQQAMVGSQKRKARKESITRRDVSAIEQEVASLLPLTINGFIGYFQEAPIILSPAFNNDIVQKDIKSDIFSRQTTSPIIPMITATTSISSSPLSLSSSALQTSASSSSVSPASPQQSDSNTTANNRNSDEAINDYSDIIKNNEKSNETINDNISSSTSDLLILAEVAANRTEFKH